MSEMNAGCSGDCGTCGSGCEDRATVTLTLDNDEVIECEIICIYRVEEQKYIALLPLDENGNNEDGEVYLYRYDEVNGSPSLDNIEEDDEYEAAAEGFDAFMNSVEFDDIIEKDE